MVCQTVEIYIKLYDLQELRYLHLEEGVKSLWLEEEQVENNLKEDLEDVEEQVNGLNLLQQNSSFYN